MKKKVMALFLLSILLVMSLAACSAKMDKAENTAYDQSTDSAKGSTSSPETPESAPAEDYDVVSEEKDKNYDELSSTSAITTNDELLSSQDKIIRRVFMDVETQEFDTLISSIDTKINQLGGYIQSSEISGRRYYYSDDLRYGNIIARVPKNKLNEFINTVKKEANVISKQEQTENVTLEYVDTESRKKALEIEQERLLSLLEKVETLEDIITLETRLSSVRYELQSYETKLRTLDNLVDYSTVTLSIQEVEHMSPAVETERTVWNRIQTGFGNTMFQLSEGLKNFFVWFVVTLPYLIIWALIITAVALIFNKYLRKKKVRNIPNVEHKNETIKKENDR
jgi:hypothetical protein